MDEKAPARAVTEAWRALVPRHSELRRTSDRIELAARWTVLLLALLMIPIVLAFASTVADSSERSGEAARATRHAVTATVVAAPDHGEGGDAAAAGRSSSPDRAPVRWIGRDGAPRVGTALVGGDASPGATTTVWVDDADHPVTRPPGRGEGRAVGVLVGFVALCAVSLAASLLLRSVRWLLDRRRLRDWEREWEIIGRLGRGSAR